MNPNYFTKDYLKSLVPVKVIDIERVSTRHVLYLVEYENLNEAIWRRAKDVPNSLTKKFNKEFDKLYNMNI